MFKSRWKCSNPAVSGAGRGSRRRIEELVAHRSDELRGKQIAEAVTSNQIVEGAIESARSALSDKEQLANIMIHAIRKGSRIASAGMQAEEEAEQEAAREAAK